jgi:hypothetical protein
MAGPEGSTWRGSRRREVASRSSPLGGPLRWSPASGCPKWRSRPPLARKHRTAAIQLCSAKANGMPKSTGSPPEVVASENRPARGDCAGAIGRHDDAVVDLDGTMTGFLPTPLPMIFGFLAPEFRLTVFLCPILDKPTNFCHHIGTVERARSFEPGMQIGRHVMTTRSRCVVRGRRLLREFCC